MKKPWYKNKLIWIIGIPILIILISIPFIINYLYMKGTPDGKADTSFSASDMLSLYGSILAFLGTVALGGLALYQNKKANNTNEMIMEMTRREKMAYFYPTGLNTISCLKPSICFINKGNSFGTITNIQIKINSVLYKESIGSYFIDNNEQRDFPIELKKSDFENNEILITFTFTWHNSFGFMYIQEINLMYEKCNDEIFNIKQFLLKNTSTLFKEYKEETQND